MPFVTTEEAALRLGVTRSRVRAMIRSGALTSQKGGTRDHLIDESELNAYAAKDRPPGRPTIAETAQRLGITLEELQDRRREARHKSKKAT